MSDWAAQGDDELSWDCLHAYHDECRGDDCVCACHIPDYQHDDGDDDDH